MAKRAPKPSSLKQTILTPVQRIWLEQARKVGGKLEAVDMVKLLRGKLPKDFNVYNDVGPFWTNGTITVFGLYKLDPGNEVLKALDKVFAALRDKFAPVTGKRSAYVSELATECKLSQELVQRLFTNGYLNDFWHDYGNSRGSQEHDHAKKEWYFSFSDANAVQSLFEYKGLEDQIEAQWAKRFAPPRILDLGTPVGNISDLVSGTRAVDGAGRGSTAGGKVPPKGKGGAKFPVTVDAAARTATWKAQVYGVNDEQLAILDACIRFALENSKPWVLKIETVRDMAANKDLKTVSRAFGHHKLYSIFKTKPEKGYFEFKP